jgi:hypothetical protein
MTPWWLGPDRLVFRKGFKCDPIGLMLFIDVLRGDA